ncbi:MAG TPA: DUF4350 domain-containing protein [Armatimonadota bacterium]|nr:DUF4350 domain-containing protein [Armatimonadota bacterium]
MKVPREAWWLAGLVIAILLLGHFVVRGAPPQSAAARRTTYSTAPDGMLAFFLTLRELGYDARRLHVPFGDSTLPRGASLVVAEPLVPVTEREMAALKRWVAKGHTLVLAGEDFAQRTTAAFPQADLLEEPPVTYARPAQPTYLAQGVKRLAVCAYRRIAVPARPRSAAAGQADADRRWFAPRPGATEDALQAAIPVFADAEGTVVAYAHLGEGRVIFLSSPWSLSNEGIRRADDLIFAINALGARPGGAVYFDEYHQGYGQNVAWGLIPLPLKLALANLLVGILLVLYARGRRFGAPTPLDARRRERSEFLGTMTALLRAGHATRLAVRTALEHAVQGLRLETGLAPSAQYAELVRAVSRINPDAAPRLESALRRCQTALDGRGTLSEAQAVALVRELDDAVRSVRKV